MPVEETLFPTAPDPPKPPPSATNVVVPTPPPSRRAAAPSRWTPATIGLAVLSILVLLLAVALWNARQPATPRDDDSRFIAVGRSYRVALADDYGRAWDDGAKLLEAGQPVKTALEQVKTSFEANRLATFRQAIKPELAKIIPDGKPEQDITKAERGAYARAFRGLARGLKR